MRKTRSYPEYEGNLAEDLINDNPKAQLYLYDYLLVVSNKKFEQVSKDRSLTPEDRASIARFEVYNQKEKFNGWSNNALRAFASRVLMSKVRNYPKYDGNLAEDLINEKPKAQLNLYYFLVECSEKYFWQVSKDMSQESNDRAHEIWYVITKGKNSLYGYSNNHVFASARWLLRQRNKDYYKKYIKSQNESLRAKYNLIEEELERLGGEVNKDDLSAEFYVQLGDSEDNGSYEKIIISTIEKIDLEFPSEQDDFQPQSGNLSQPQTSSDYASLSIRTEELFRIFWEDMTKTNLPTYKQLSFWLRSLYKLEVTEIAIILKSLISSESIDINDDEDILTTCFFDKRSKILLEVKELLEKVRIKDVKGVDKWLKSSINPIIFSIIEEQKVNKDEVIELLNTVHENLYELESSNVTATNVSHWANQCKSKLAEITILK